MKDKYRGKTFYGKWVYGYFYKFKGRDPDGYFYTSNIMNEDGDVLEVIPESVGQCTGSKDIEKVDIYQGDFVEFSQDNVFCKSKKCYESESDSIPIGKFCPDCGKELKKSDYIRKAEIKFKSGGFCLSYVNKSYRSEWQIFIAENYINSLKIIGNKTDTPELLK